MSTSRAADILASSNVWDMTVPWIGAQQDVNILRRFHQAGVKYISVTTMNFPVTMESIETSIGTTRAMVDSEPDWLAIGTSIDEIDRGMAAGKLVLGFNVQETVQLGLDVSRVEQLHRLGVRHMLLAYQLRNFVADGCAEPANAGLSIFGRHLIAEMNRVGMVVDCSHTGERSSLDAIDLTATPPIFSHSNPYGVYPHIRNISDDQIRACARKGGVVGVVGIGAFLGDPDATSATMFRHIDYVANLVGPRHVGIGTDFVDDMAGTWAAARTQMGMSWPDPTGTQFMHGECFQPEQLPELVELMLAHDYKDEDVKGILGENFRRVFAVAEGAGASG